MIIRPLQPDDWIGDILHDAFSAGDSYAVPDMNAHDAQAWWCAPHKTVHVAELDGHVVGTYYLRPNADGRGAHVCNCGYVTARAARGRGVASAMLRHSLALARSHGFLGMQFNAVVSTNSAAVRLWEKAGFKTVGRVPGAFRHPHAGYVDTLIMYMPLAEGVLS